MEIFKELVKLDNTVVGLGFFDGVHIAHRELIAKLVETAKSNNLKSVLVTFKKSPAENFISNVEYLLTNKEKESIVSKLGVDFLVELDFDNKMMNLSPEEYISDVIVKYLNPKYIFTGFNHTFGKCGLGNSCTLENLSKVYSFEYVKIPEIKYQGEPISSTRIKNLLKEGNVEQANQMLDSKFSLCGVVQQGNQIGRTIGFPTANFVYPSKKVKIPFGVYSAEVFLDKAKYKGILNYGIKPTLDNEKTPLLEVNIFDFDKNIYNDPIKINLLKWIRAERKFDSLEELKVQIEKDLKEC